MFYFNEFILFNFKELKANNLGIKSKSDISTNPKTSTEENKENMAESINDDEI